MSIEDPPPQDGRFAIVQTAMDWPGLSVWESVFSLSNGLLGMRGSFEEPMPGTRSRPMTFMAGLYDTRPKGLPELPVLPDWITTRIVLAGSPFDLRRGRVLKFTRWLDMKRGLLGRQVVWRDVHGRATELAFLRFLSLPDRHVGVLRIRVTPVDWSGPVGVEAVIAGPSGGKRSHWRPARLRSASPKVATISTRTRQTRRPLAVAGAFEARAGDDSIPGDSLAGDGVAGQACTFEAQRGRTYAFDRFVAFMSDGPHARPPTTRARRLATEACRDGFAALLDRHTAACADMWDRIDVEIDGPADEQRAIRFNLFQLATLCPRPGDVASIGPKGLSGTHYLGHIFWDTEIYMLPFFSLTDPAGARTLLMYRYKTLDGARAKARATGYRGAR